MGVVVAPCEKFVEWAIADVRQKIRPEVQGVFACVGHGVCCHQKMRRRGHAPEREDLRKQEELAWVVFLHLTGSWMSDLYLLFEQH
jgi:hypothetical protein